MPINYDRDDRRRLITVTPTDPFTLDELLSQTDRQWSEHTWEYAVLYDMRSTTYAAPPSEIKQLLDRTLIVGQGRPRGPVGVAIPPRTDMFNSGLQLSQSAGPLRDVEVLLNGAQVDAWIARHATRRGL